VVPRSSTMKSFPKCFEEFLESLSFSSSESSKEYLIELWNKIDRTQPSGIGDTLGAARLYQLDRCELSLESFRQAVTDSLKKANHVANDLLADALLGCVVHAHKTGANRLACLESALRSIQDADVSHYFLLPQPCPDDPIEFDGYRFGELNLEVFGYRCSKAGSNYFELYGDSHKGSYALQSPIFRHSVVDFSIFGIQQILSDYRFRDLMLHYFERVATIHRSLMWDDLSGRQLLAIPFNQQALDVSEYREAFLHHASGQISIYWSTMRDNKAGYVVPTVERKTYSGINSKSLERFIQHRTQYAHMDILDSVTGNSELGRAIRDCARFCGEGQSFLALGRTDDAALYAIICLEQLFSDKSNTTDALAKRTAALTHLRMNTSFDDALRELKRLYKARSEFVHSGKSVSHVHADRLCSYANEALRSLIVLHKIPENRQSFFLDRWLTQLDAVVGAFKAGWDISNLRLAEVGIFPMPDCGSPP
jgi:hypothetical protein